MPSDPRPMTSYKRSSVTIALSCTETLFSSRWPWSDFSRSPKVKLIMPSDPWPMIDFLLVFYSKYSKISHINSCFSADDLDLTLKGHQRSNWLRHPIRNLKVTIVFFSNYSVFSKRNRVFQQMTLFWPFKVNKGQTNYAIRSEIYEFLLVFYSNYSAISHRNEKLWKSTRLDRKHPRVPKNPEVYPGFLGHSDMVALRNSEKWIPWPRKRREWRNCVLRKFSILLYLQSKCWSISW